MTDNYIGHIIKETRLKKQISSSKLCAGLCSPSMLTRIESGERYPSKLLFHALMERMGESGKNYNFVGSTREAELHHLLDLIVTYYSHRNYEKFYIYLEQYRNIMNPKNSLELQILYSYECIASKENLLALYDKIISAIKLTIKDFDLLKIQYYTLSNHERLLINSLGCYYILAKEYDKAIDIFKRLLFFIENYENLNNDILHISSIVKYNLVICYLNKKEYNEILYLCSKEIPKTILSHQEIILSRLYYQNCYAKLALDNNRIDEDILLAYYIFLDIDEFSFAERLRKDIKADFNLSFEVSFY